MHPTPQYFPFLQKIILAIVLFFLIPCTAFSQTAGASTSLCHIDRLPSINFEKHGSKLNAKARGRLDFIAKKLAKEPGCAIELGGYCCAEKEDSVMLQVRINNAIKYLVNTKGIAKNRILFTLDCPAEDFLFVSAGDYDTIKLMPVPGSIKQRWRSFGIDEFHGELRQELIRRQAKTGNRALLLDDDMDGIPNQLDLEPNTPSGADVDAHGRAIDTDGDGVPDYKDKEKLTLQICFPVSLDGIGNCPEPACCRNIIIVDPPFYGDYDLHESASFKFTTDHNTVDSAIVRTLNKMVVLLSAHPKCNLKVVGYVGATAGLKGQQLSWDRVYTIINYFRQNGLYEGRLIFSYENGGDGNTIDLMPTNEAGPHIVPPPHPLLSTLKNMSWKQIQNEVESQ